MAVSDRIHSAASKRMTAWSRQTLPGSWALIQWVALAGFALWLVFALLGGGDDSAAQVSGKSVDAMRWSPSQSTTAAATTVPTTSGSSTATGALVQVLDSTGALQDVPAAAAKLAGDAMRAMYDPAVAATVPQVGGGTLPAPSTAYPGAVVGSLTLVAGGTEDTLSFAASADADGDAGKFSPVQVTVTVTLQDGTWMAVR